MNNPIKLASVFLKDEDAIDKDLQNPLLADPNTATVLFSGRKKNYTFWYLHPRTH